MGKNPQQPQDPRANDGWRLELSRHYDNLQWIVIPIFSAAVGALLFYSFTDSTQEAWPELFGISLTLIGVYYVASYRRFRGRIHGSIENQKLREYLNKPGGPNLIPQWNLFVSVFAGIDALYVWRISKKINGHHDILIMLLIFVLVLLFIYWKIGMPEATNDDNN